MFKHNYKKFDKNNSFIYVAGGPEGGEVHDDMDTEAKAESLSDFLGKDTMSAMETEAKAEDARDVAKEQASEVLESDIEKSPLPPLGEKFRKSPREGLKILAGMVIEAQSNTMEFDRSKVESAVKNALIKTVANEVSKIAYDGKEHVVTAIDFKNFDQVLDFKNLKVDSPYVKKESRYENKGVWTLTQDEAMQLLGHVISRAEKPDQYASK